MLGFKRKKDIPVEDVDDGPKVAAALSLLLLSNGDAKLEIAWTPHLSVERLTVFMDNFVHPPEKFIEFLQRMSMEFAKSIGDEGKINEVFETIRKVKELKEKEEKGPWIMPSDVISFHNHIATQESSDDE